jgi:SAM-dependent methyltransferase
MTDLLDKVKNYWNERPCNIKHSNKNIGTKEYFEEVENRRYKVEPHILEFAQFDKYKNKKVLEIGCGIGTDTISFLKGGAILTSVDISEQSVALTKRRLEIYGYDADVRYANAEKMTEFLEPTKFDLVYSFGVLHHTPNPVEAFKQVKNFMNNESEFKMMLYHKGAFKVFQILEEYEWDYDRADELIAKHSEAQTGCPVTYTYTPIQITKILNDIGFVVERIDIRHIFPYKIQEYKNYEYVKENIWNMPDETFRIFEQKYGWHLLITSKLKK